MSLAEAGSVAEILARRSKKLAAVNRTRLSGHTKSLIPIRGHKANGGLDPFSLLFLGGFLVGNLRAADGESPPETGGALLRLPSSVLVQLQPPIVRMNGEGEDDMQWSSSARKFACQTGDRFPRSLALPSERARSWVRSPIGWADSVLFTSGTFGARKQEIGVC